MFTEIIDEMSQFLTVVSSINSYNKFSPEGRCRYVSCSIRRREIFSRASLHNRFFCAI